MAFSIFAAVSSQGALFYNSNNFVFTAGDLVGQDGWAAHSAAGSVPIQVTSDGIIALEQGGGPREDANVAFGAIAAGQTYFFGLDVIVDADSANVYFAHFKDTGNDFTTRTFVTPFGGADFTFGLSAAGSSPDVTWATGLDFGTTYRLIGSYDADTQLTQLWVDPTDIDSTSISFTDPAPNNVSAFALRQATNSTSTQMISNVYVGSSFEAALTGIPEPSTALLGGLGILALLRRRR